MMGEKHIGTISGADAVQWDGTRQGGREIVKWAAGYETASVYVAESEDGVLKLMVRTIEEKTAAQPGDWIMKAKGVGFRLVGEHDLQDDSCWPAPSMNELYEVSYIPATRSTKGRVTGWTLVINDQEFSGVYTLKEAQGMVSAYIQKHEVPALQEKRG